MTGPRVNTGAGYGLEIPRVYKFYGPKPYTDKVLNILDFENLTRAQAPLLWKAP